MSRPKAPWSDLLVNRLLRRLGFGPTTIGMRNPGLTGRTSATCPPNPEQVGLQQYPELTASVRAGMKVAPGELEECPRCGELVPPEDIWWQGIWSGHPCSDPERPPVDGGSVTARGSASFSVIHRVHEDSDDR